MRMKPAGATGGLKMDPNATLERLRELVAENAAAETDAHKADLADAFAELVEALDNWICCGGFIPLAWTNRGVACPPCR